MNLKIQEYNIDVKGIGCPIIKSGGSEVMIPTFGYDENGNAKSRILGDKEGYAPLKREWIDNQIDLSVKAYLSGYKDNITYGRRYASDPFDYEIEKDENKPDCETVYVFVFSRSDCPNEIGMATNDVPFELIDSSFTFTESKIV